VVKDKGYGAAGDAPPHLSLDDVLVGLGRAVALVPR
jgi:hypothetical protein